MSKDASTSRSLKDITISALLGAIFTIAFLGYNGIQNDIEKLETSKAEKDVIKVELRGIKSELSEIKEMLKIK